MYVYVYVLGVGFMIEVLKNVHQVTPEWLTQVLKEKNLINSAVISVELETIGVGLMAELAPVKFTRHALSTFA